MLGVFTLIGVAVVVILQIATLLAIAQEKQRMTTSIAQLDAAIAAEAASDEQELQTLQGAVTKVDADITTLLEQIQAGGKVDVTAELESIQANTAALKSGVDSAVASLSAADAQANAPTGLSVDHTSASLSVSNSGGFSATAVVNASQAAGPLSATSSDPTVATVAPASAPGPAAAFAITAVAPGSATIAITDGKTTADVNVGVVA